MHAVRLLALAAALLVAGCAGPAAKDDGSGDGAAAATMSIIGLVQDEDLAAVPGATVQVRLQNLTTTTDAAGGFRFDGLLLSAYLVDVSADGFENATLTAAPTTGTNASLNFVLAKPASQQPSLAITHFEGIYQCAFEAFIIPGSCDVLLEETGLSPFSDTSTFQLGLAPRWQAIAIDVDFDLSANPGLEGLRLVVRGLDDSDQLNAYQQYGRFSGAEPFTATLAVGGTYEDGDAPVPGNLTALELVVYPQGRGYHQVCEPTEQFGCFLGAGAGVDVTFDLYVTVFYNQPAPTGYTLLT